MDACLPQAQPAVPLQPGILFAPPSLDLARYFSRHHLGRRIHFQLHFPLQTNQAAVVFGAPRTLHRPDDGAQITHRDQHRHRRLHLHLAHQIRLETADAENGEDRGHFVFRSRRCVRITPVLPANTPFSPASKRLLTTTYRCVIIGIVRFWQIFVIDLIGNLTGTSLTTFMLCSIELMLAGLCINIPMLRPFYLRWRTQRKMSQGGSQAFNQGTGGFKSIRSDQLAENEPAHGPAKHTAWIELVSRNRNRKSTKKGTWANASREDDKEHDTLNDDDSGSQRKLTCDQPSAIHVSKNWSVASTHAL